MLIEKVHAFSKTLGAKVIFSLIILSFALVGVNGTIFSIYSHPDDQVIGVGNVSFDRDALVRAGAC